MDMPPLSIGDGGYCTGEPFALPFGLPPRAKRRSIPLPTPALRHGNQRSWLRTPLSHSGLTF